MLGVETEKMKNIKEIILINQEKEIGFNHVITATTTSDLTLHLHNDFELFVFVCGDVDFMIEDQYIALSPGTVILAKENVLHKPIIKTAKPYERFYMTIPYDAFNGLCQGADPMEFLQKDVSILTLDIAHFHKLLNMLNMISEAISKPEFREYYLVYAYILQIMKLLNDAVEDRTAVSVARHADMPGLVHKVLNYVDAHAHEIGSVKQIASVFFVNPSYLSDLFSKTVKINLKHYLTVKKIALSKEMLGKDMSVTDVAYQCGFSSCSHFISVFKKNTGQTPDEYRRTRL